MAAFPPDSSDVHLEAAPDGPVLVLLPARDLDRPEVDLLRVACELAASTGNREVVALWPHVDADPQHAATAATLGGVHRLLRPVAQGEGAEHLTELLAASVPQAVADAAVTAAHEVRPSLILAAAGVSATDTAGLLAVRLGSAAIVDGAVLDPSPDGLRITRRVLDSTWTTIAEFDGGIGVVTVQFGARVGVEDAAGAPDTSGTIGTGPEVVELQVTASPATLAIALTAHTATEGVQSLSGAERVVVAGRGTRGDLTLTEELAAELDAALGATRVVTDQGWAPRELQVGQSGVVISPRLYLGLGASGQIHHTMGIMGAQYITAICDDPGAPIFEIADYGIVGDIDTVVPQLLESLREGR